ncbi:hypothetical protein [Photobacterium leiognathi]|uniref:hypothetical protein n=1 Tax=Photobacterium leiognathi TaxID=553611 RepID=UPI002738CAC5|nr:hypothetical protein [Photobacterium leiognathi]
MKDTKNFNIALLAVVSRGAKLFLGPITLLIISAQLSSDELGYYYTFFSFISMQMLVELGIGHVIKQYISHAYIEKDGEWLESSKIKIKRYYYFSICWFVGVALFLMFVIVLFWIYVFLWNKKLW